MLAILSNGHFLNFVLSSSEQKDTVFKAQKAVRFNKTFIKDGIAVNSIGP